jgi:hypothetical protein
MFSVLELFHAERAVTIRPSHARHSIIATGALLDDRLTQPK